MVSLFPHLLERYGESEGDSETLGWLESFRWKDLDLGWNIYMEQTLFSLPLSTHHIDLDSEERERNFIALSHLTVY